MIPVGGRTSYGGDVLAVVVAETHQQARARRRRWSTCSYDVLDPVTDPLQAALADGAPLAVWGTDRQRTQRHRVLTRRCRRWSRGSGARRPRGASRRNASSTPSSNRRARWPCHRRTTADAICTCTPAGQGCGTTATTSPGPDRRPRSVDRDVGVQRRRVRRQGGHGQPGPDCAGRVAPRPSGEVHAVARGEPADPRQASPDPPGVLGGLRRRWSADWRCACAASATVAPTPVWG